MPRIGVVLGTVLALALLAEARADPLPPFEDWQQVALAPEDVGSNYQVWFDEPMTAPDGTVYRRALSQLVADGVDIIVTLAEQEADQSAPHAPPLLVPVFANGARIEQVAGVEPPADFGPETRSQTFVTSDPRGERVTADLAWRYGGWQIDLSVAASDSVDAVHALLLDLASRQLDKLLALFPP